MTSPVGTGSNYLIQYSVKIIKIVIFRTLNIKELFRMAQSNEVQQKGLVQQTAAVYWQLCTTSPTSQLHRGNSATNAKAEM
jgi:hypothetical protein